MYVLELITTGMNQLLIVPVQDKGSHETAAIEAGSLVDGTVMK